MNPAYLHRNVAFSQQRHCIMLLSAAAPPPPWTTRWDVSISISVSHWAGKILTPAVQQPPNLHYQRHQETPPPCSVAALFSAPFQSITAQSLSQMAPMDGNRLYLQHQSTTSALISLEAIRPAFQRLSYAMTLQPS